MSEQMIDHRSELARRFCAALISKRLGIGMDYALKNYVKNAGESEYWLELADRVERDVVEHLEEEFMPTENETKKCPHCDGTMVFSRNASVAGAQASSGDIWPIDYQPAWVCNKNREHYELVSA